MHVSDVRLSLCNLRSKCNLVILFLKGHLPHYKKKAPFEVICARFEKKKMHSTPIERH